MPSNPYAPMAPGYGVYPSYGGGYSSSGSGSSDPYSDWLSSPLGQNWDQAKEAEAAYARKQADFEMSQKKAQLNLQVAALKQQGRLAEAELALKRGDQQIARDRLAQELQIHNMDLQQRQYEFGQTQGLSRAQAYAQYASTPDRLFMLSDLQDALTRAGQGLGPRPYGMAGGTPSTPTPKTYAGFEQLAGPFDPNAAGAGGGGQPSAGGGGSTMLGSGQMNQATGASPDAGTSQGADPRGSAISSVLKAAGGGSDELGLDANDQAALSAIQNIISLRRPGTLQRMRPGQQQAFMGGASRLGYWAPDVQADFTRSAPGQGSSPSALW